MKNLELMINQNRFDIPNGSSDLELNLLEYLRKEGFTGCKKVCSEGGCGACTVILSRWIETQKKIEHIPVTSCLVPIPTVHKMQITTIEGIAKLTTDAIHPICDAFYQLGASQCGFCTPGFILALVARLENQKVFFKNELEHIFDGNLCRCTGYRPILDAASVFCQDPLENSEYSHDIRSWKKRLNKCKTLSDVFPDEFKVPIEEFYIQGSESSWIQPTALENLTKYCQKKICNENSKLFAGNTDLGYLNKKNPTVYSKRISVNHVQELKRVEWLEKGLKIGAAVTIEQLRNELEHSLPKIKGEQSSGLFALFNQCRFIGNNQVRHMGTVGGGIVNFSYYSDLIPVWVANRAEFHFILDGKERIVEVNNLYRPDGTMNFDPQQEGLLVSILVPYSNPNEVLSSYKYARRRLDSITFLSAGLYARINKQEEFLEEVIICFDGLGSPGIRAVKTEEVLRGKTWDNELLHLSLNTLKEELNQAITNPLPGRFQQYQIRLGLGVLVRFYAKYHKHFFGKTYTYEEKLVSRYPNVTHRANIKYNESKIGVLGKAIPHRNAKNQTTGKAKYTTDQNIPGCLYGALVRSPVACGTIVAIDAKKALQCAGVIGFFSAKDIPGKNLFGFRVEDEEVLASRRVGYVGQILGILVAKSERAAKKCAALVQVNVKSEKPLLTIEDALEANSFHGKPEGYLIHQGDLETGFSESHVILNGEIKTPPQSHFYLESQCALVIPKDDGFEIHSSTQSPSNVVDHISRVLNISKNKVEVRVGRLGGGFGGKQLRAGPIAAICAVASHHTEQPVKLSLDRHEDMAYCPGRSPTLAKYKVGFDKGGKIKFLDIQFYLGGGYTNDYSADITETATLLMDSCYYIPNVKVHGFCLKTNFGSYTAARGFGKPQASAIMENILDHGAVKLNLDPTYLRQTNLYKKGHLTITKTKIDNDVAWLCWKRLLEKSRYKKLKIEVDEFNQKNKWLKRGIAAVSSKGNMGFIESDDINRGLAVVHILRDGTVSLNHSGCEMGQGINTRMAQVTANQLNVALENVDVTDTQSALIPNTPPTTMVASDLIGRAIINACDELKEKLRKINGTFQEKVKKAYIEGVTLSSTGVYTAPRLQYDYDKQEGDISYFFVWGAALSIVELDIISGNFRLLKSDIVQDCGKSLNPHLDVGQAEGGFIFGLGLYTMEELLYGTDGQLITDNVSGYKIPSCGDVPLDWNIELLNYKPTGEGLHSSKGIGESNTQLGLSAYFAIKEAIRAARKDMGMDPYFKMDFPASVERVSACLPAIEKFVSI